jgi:cation transport protein ChaC
MLVPAVWIFGYGSLLFRPDFPFDRREIVTLDGWERRFWQGSTDHRGVPEAPGRVVTLVARRSASCRGIAFRVTRGEEQRVLAYLDHRERGGYTRTEVTLTRHGARLEEAAITYIAHEGNPCWLGDAPLEAIARQVRHAVGPSGRNLDYVLSLERVLGESGIHDAHVSELAAQLREPV